MTKFRILCLVTVLLALSHVEGEKYVVCYYGTWATYRHGLGKFDVHHINPDLCTHAIYTFAGLDDEGTVISLDPWLDLPDNWGRNNFGAFNALKQKNPQLKTLLAVGGWNFGSAKFSVMAANPNFRHNFVTSSVQMLQQHGFDGLDLDWEYPNRRDTVHGEADIDNFTVLLRELREEFDKHGLILSAAVSAVRAMASLSYDVPAISRYLHLINVMTYDMYGPWDAVTGHNAPLHYGEGDEGAIKDELYTVDVALQYWIEEGAPPEKLTVGVPFYGRTFTLTDSNNNAVRAPASGPGVAGQFTATNGFLGYNEFCTKLETESWTKKYDDLAKVPYAHSGQNWVSYDDADSITEKVEYSLQYGVAGIMIWSIETDDFHGSCGNEDFPLLRAVNKALGRDGRVDVSTDPPTTTDTTEAPSLPTTLLPESTTIVDTTSTTLLPDSTVEPTSIPTTLLPDTTTTPEYIPTTWIPDTTTVATIPTTLLPDSTSEATIPTTLLPDSTTTTIPTTPLPETTSEAASVPTTLLPDSTTAAILTTPMFPDTTTLVSSISTTAVTSEPTTSEGTTRRPTTMDPDCICVEEGFAPDPASCSSFFMCVTDKDGIIRAWKFQCPIDLSWDVINSVCNYSYLVNCNR